MHVENHSRLYYHGTREEVRLGDRVRIKRWLRRDLVGIVCYIPGISRLHSEMEFEDIKQWAIRLENGDVVARGYTPEDPLVGQPSKRIQLIGRGDDGLLVPDEHLE